MSRSLRAFDVVSDGAPNPMTAALLSERWRNTQTTVPVVGFTGRGTGPDRYASFSNFHIHSPVDMTIPTCCGAEALRAAGRSSNIQFTCGEQAIMLCKAAAMGDVGAFDSISRTRKPIDIKAQGRQVAPFDQDLWDRVVCTVARSVVLAKFRGVPELASLLLSTGDSIIAEAVRSDRVWGTGVDFSHPDAQVPSRWVGSNILGWALMEARAELATEVVSAGSDSDQDEAQDVRSELEGEEPASGAPDSGTAARSQLSEVTGGGRIVRLIQPGGLATFCSSNEADVVVVSTCCTASRLVEEKGVTDVCDAYGHRRVGRSAERVAKNTCFDEPGTIRRARACGTATAICLYDRWAEGAPKRGAALQPPEGAHFTVNTDTRRQRRYWYQQGLQRVAECLGTRSATVAFE